MDVAGVANLGHSTQISPSPFETALINKNSDPSHQRVLQKRYNVNRGKNHVVAVHQDDYEVLCDSEIPDRFVLSDGSFNIRDRYGILSRYYERGRYHTLLELPEWGLAVLCIAVYVVWAVIHAGILAVLTSFDVTTAVGDEATSILDYYFFVVETMFAIGFGSPRHPACFVTNCYVTIIVASTMVLSGVILGIIFAKFSSSARHRFACKFSKTVCIASLADTCGDSESELESPISSKFSQRSPTDGVNDSLKVPIKTPEGSAVRKPRRRLSSVPLPQYGNQSGDYASLYNPISRRAATFASNPLYESMAPEDTFSMSFRLKSVNPQHTFGSTVSVYLLHHSAEGLSISDFPSFSTDVPLPFLQLPVVVTVDNRYPHSPLYGLLPEHLATHGFAYELMVVLSFVDSCTATPVEIRHSWNLGALQWGRKFRNVICRPKGNRRLGTYEVKMCDLDTTEECTDNKTRELVERITTKRFPSV